MGNGGQQRHNNNRPRRFGSNGGSRQHGGDDSANIARTRRNATQSREKYQNMARDAMSIGDRVLAENYLQHADHYYRILLSLPAEEVRQPYHQRTEHAPQSEGEPQFQGGDAAPQPAHMETPSSTHPPHVAESLSPEILPE